MSRKLTPEHLAAIALGKSLRPNEGADNYPAIVARLNEAWRVIVCPDGIQWILQSRRGAAPGWKNRSYCQSREGLLRCIGDLARDKKVVSEAGPLASLSSLPDHIHDKPKEVLSQEASKHPKIPIVVINSPLGGPTVPAR